MQPIANIDLVHLSAEVDDGDFSLGRARRAVRAEVEGAQDITVSVAEGKGHLRDRTDEFINALLDVVSAR